MSGTPRSRAVADTLGGAITGAAIGKGVAKYVLIVEPSGVASVIVIAIFFLLGGAAGMCGYKASGGGNGNGN